MVTPLQTTLRLSLPNSAIAGTPLTAQVQALDPNGQINPNYQGLVVFSSSDAAATLPALYTFAVADSGSKTWPDGVVLKTAGVQTVAVDDQKPARAKSRSP